MSHVDWRSGALAVVALVAMGCSAELEHYNSDADTGSTHALITIQRSVSADAATTPRAEALAGFVRVPVDVESKPVYELLGLKRTLPTQGCKLRRSQPEGNPSLSAIGRVELLDAGDVLVGVPGSEATLAPHAFPTVTDQISGVVYTSRDRSTALLPAAATYAVRTNGGVGAPSVNITREAPADLDGVTVGGVDIANVASVAVGQPIDLTWNVGAAGDRVVVEIATNDGAATALCSFRDDLGAASVPQGTLPATGPGHLSLHRIRTTSFVAPDVDVGELSFDFELDRSVSFTP